MNNDNLASWVGSAGAGFGGMLASITCNELPKVPSGANVKLKRATAFLKATRAITSRDHSTAQACQPAVEENPKEDLLNRVCIVVVDLSRKVDTFVVVMFEAGVDLVGRTIRTIQRNKMLKTV